MSVHEQFAEDLALYALGGLQGTSEWHWRSIWRSVPRAAANWKNSAGTWR